MGKRLNEYCVIGHYSASSSSTVRAATPEAAAENYRGSVSLCHQCSDELDLGDCYGVTVLSPDYKEVLIDGIETTLSGASLEQLCEEIARRTAEARGDASKLDEIEARLAACVAAAAEEAAGVLGAIEAECDRVEEGR